jgi:hypothetical protein
VGGYGIYLTEENEVFNHNVANGNISLANGEFHPSNGWISPVARQRISLQCEALPTVWA